MLFNKLLQYQAKEVAINKRGTIAVPPCSACSIAIGKLSMVPNNKAGLGPGITILGRRQLQLPFNKPAEVRWPLEAKRIANICYGPRGMPEHDLSFLQQTLHNDLRCGFVCYFLDGFI